MDSFFSFSLLTLSNLSLLYSNSRMSGTGGGTTSTTSHSKFEDETGLSLQGRHGRSERRNNDISM